MTEMPKILYVDDEIENCEMVRFLFNSEFGINIVTELDGEGAMKRIGREHFDVYILDYCLPDTTGIELCKWIKTATADSKVIFYSALDRPIDLERAIDAGADRYLIKPEDSEKLAGVVRELLELEKKQVAIGNGYDALHAVSHKTATRVRRKCSGIT